MKKSELFDILMNKVCEVCEVRYLDIVQGRRMQSVVDARMLLVQYLRRGGLSNDDIALIFICKVAQDCPSIDAVKRKAKNIDRLYLGYRMRIKESRIFALMSDELDKFCLDFFRQSVTQPATI